MRCEAIRPLRAYARRALCLLPLLCTPPALAQPAGRIAECRIESAGKVELAGQCRFVPEQGSGSFALEHLDRTKPLFGTILFVHVSIISAGVAEVRGLTRDGINSRWGEAKRSTGDTACWVGSDFTICAR